MTSVVEHTCWSYDELPEFQAHALEFLRAGAALGEFTWYVGVSATPEVTAVLGGDGRFVDVLEAYAVGAVVDPGAQVASYAAATQAALDAGYSGLRVAAEVSCLLGSPAQLDAFARYEFAVGRYMLTAPMRAVCGYDRSVLGSAAVAEVACLHPRSNPDTTSFHLHPADPVRSDVFLDGELDAATEDLFTAALGRIDSAGFVAGAEFVVHADDLHFVDHRSLLILDRFAGQHDVTTVLRTRRPGVRHLSELLELGRVRVEVVA